MSTVFQMYKGDISCGLLWLGKMCLAEMHTWPWPLPKQWESILGHLVGTFLEWFQRNIRNVEMVCSIIVIKQTFKRNSSRKS